jgi:hypothetical protein
MSDGERDNLQQLILRYLSAHPFAADSLKGICDWWVPMQRLCEVEQDVRDALSALAETGQIVEFRLLDGQTMYRASDKPDLSQ